MPAARPKLLHGPYAAPASQVGDLLNCVIRGEVRVVGFSDAPIPWPMTRMLDGVGKPFLIVGGGLLDAFRHEGQRAIVAAWGISIATIARWRLALRDPAYRDKLQSLYHTTDRVATVRERQAGQCRARSPRRRGPAWAWPTGSAGSDGTRSGSAGNRRGMNCSARYPTVR